MATRARIGLKLEDGSIISAYHHWDGYPEWLGVTLKEHYNTKEDIAKLIEGGNMSSCYSDNQYDEEKQEFVKNDPKPEYYGCLLYTSPSPRDPSISRMPSSA